MRFRRLLTTVPLALAATLVAPVSANAATPDCAAAATPPHQDPTQPGVRGSGTFACFDGSYDLLVTVCVEELDGLSWTTLGCSSSVLNDGGGWHTAEVTVEAPEETTVLRTYVTGSNGEGDTASATSAPVVWLRCGCP